MFSRLFLGDSSSEVLFFVDLSRATISFVFCRHEVR